MNIAKRVMTAALLVIAGMVLTTAHAHPGGGAANMMWHVLVFKQWKSTEIDGCHAIGIVVVCADDVEYEINAAERERMNAEKWELSKEHWKTEVNKLRRNEFTSTTETHNLGTKHLERFCAFFIYRDGHSNCGRVGYVYGTKNPYIDPY